MGDFRFVSPGSPGSILKVYACNSRGRGTSKEAGEGCFFLMALNNLHKLSMFIPWNWV